MAFFAFPQLIDIEITTVKFINPYSSRCNATAQKKVQDLNEIKLKHKEKNRFLKQRQDYLKQSE